MYTSKINAGGASVRINASTGASNLDQQAVHSVPKK